MPERSGSLHDVMGEAVLTPYFALLSTITDDHDLLSYEATMAGIEDPDSGYRARHVALKKARRAIRSLPRDDGSSQKAGPACLRFVPALLQAIERRDKPRLRLFNEMIRYHLENGLLVLNRAAGERVAAYRWIEREYPFF